MAGNQSERIRWILTDVGYFFLEIIALAIVFVARDR